MTNFIKVVSQSSTSTASSLPRSMVFATRETITGYTPNTHTGLISVTPSTASAFATANPTAYATNLFIATAFAGSVMDDQVYILSTAGEALTSAMLDTANYYPRNWSFLTVGSQTNGLTDSTTFLADCEVASNWCTAAKRKIFFHSFSMANDGTLPAALQLGGALTTNSRTKTIITNAYSEVDTSTDVYYNPLVAALAACLYGGSIARSIGSLSDAHDFEGVDGDTYDANTRAAILAASLAQYNGAQDQAGALFVYDTFMNSTEYPPTTAQIESIIAEDYINDYVEISVRNTLQAAGQTGLEASMKGVQTLYALIDTALNTLWTLGAIQTTSDNKPNYSLVMLNQAQITELNASWQTDGVIPVGSIVGTIMPFAATHYVTILFNFE